MVMTTGNWPKLLLPGIDNLFGQNYAQLPKVRDRLFEMRKSVRAFEEDVELTGVGLASLKGEGAPIEFDSFKQGLTQQYRHYAYAKAMKITMEAIDDNLYQNQINRMAPELAKSINHTIETVAANVLNRAFSTSYLYADGQPLCDTDKVLSGIGGTYANKPTVAVDLSEAALEQAVIDVQALVDGAGLRIGADVDALVIPNALQFDAHRILKSNLRVSTPDNDANALKDMGKIKDIIPWKFLTDTDAWFLTTSVPGGLVMYNRKDPKVESDNDFTTKDMMFSAVVRFSVGSSDQRGIYGSAGA